MDLYHYSNKLYSSLMSKRASGLTTSEELKEEEKKYNNLNLPGLYSDHISFFFDQIPYELMGKIYGPDHSVWYDGSKVYEYVIDTNSFHDDLVYDVCETDAKVAFYHEFLKKNKWESHDPKMYAKYVRELNAHERKLGLVGKGRNGLEEQIKKFQGGTKAAILKASRDPEFESFKEKYAANVPHLMLYPKGGIVRYESVSLVTIGSNKRQTNLTA